MESALATYIAFGVGAVAGHYRLSEIGGKRFITLILINSLLWPAYLASEAGKHYKQNGFCLGFFVNIAVMLTVIIVVGVQIGLST